MKRLIARQPLFNAREVVTAYELILSFDTAQLLSGEVKKEELPDNIRLSLYGSEDSSDEKIVDVCIDITPEILLGSDIQRLSKKSVILYLREPFNSKPEHLSALQSLKADGFRVGLGSFATDDKYFETVKLADQLVVDFRGKSESELRLVPNWCKSYNIKTVAHNLETRAAFELARKLEYNSFHGPFFHKAEYVAKEAVPGFKLNYLRLLQEINDSDISFDKLERIIKQDVSLTYGLLKYINSAAFGLRMEVESIKHALTLLGIMLVKRWATMVAIANIGKGLPVEALVTCMVRGKFLEELGHKLGHAQRGDDLFFMGIFSLIDLFFSRPLEEILEEMPIKADIKAAILGDGGQFAELLSMVKVYEDGDWKPLLASASKLGVSEDHIAGLYFDALDWTQNLFGSS
ncbi:MAG: HDOD domain-containing protein [Candidatus Marinimicrobia bacterium]|nr:HDOD domain-containing protein [Candidatus Neomarinimicrobiota bacterium]